MGNDLLEFYKDKKILITGAAGTVGKEIVKQLCFFQPSELRLLDNNETELFFMMEEYKNRDNNIFCFLGDVRDKNKVEEISNGIDVIIHCAAFKHVILSEFNPFDVVQTNILGVENIITVATNCDVKYVFYTSSDKSVNPTNVMGASKLMGEKLITAANALKNKGKTIFSSIRFGNIIGSRGSVVPLFIKQIRKGGPVTITDRRMTRFIMTVEDSAKFVLKSLMLSKGGEVFVTKMPAVRISDLAKAMIDILAPNYGYKTSDIKTVEIGSKPGEKLYEELISEEEINRSLELRDMYVITPAFKSIYRSIAYDYPDMVADKVNKTYVSNIELSLDKDAIKNYLIENEVLQNIE